MPLEQELQPCMAEGGRLLDIGDVGGLEHGERNTRDVVAQVFAGLQRGGRIVAARDDESGYVDIRQDRAMVHVAYGFAASDIALQRRRQKHLGYPGDGLGVALAKALGEPALHVGAHHRGEAVLAREARAVVPGSAVREMVTGVEDDQWT